MGKNFRYTLEKGSKKHPCPACGKRTFHRYLETETGDYIPDQYGRCDRVESCGYHLNPYKDGFTTDQSREQWSQKSLLSTFQHFSNQVHKDIRTAEPVLIPKVVLVAIIKNGALFSNFCQNLLTRVPFPFDPDDVQKVAEMYMLGTVAKGSRAGGLTIPYIDQQGGCRFIQVKTFDQDNHTTGTDSLTSIIERHHKKTGTHLPGWLEAYQKNELKVSCLFGAHLLPKYPSNRIALVEAPKTAIYGTLYFGIPETANDLLWMAVYSRDTLTVEKCKAIQGRTVYLFPDLSKDGSTFKLWQAKADEIMKALPGTRIVVSRMLEDMAGSQDREKGSDIADWLIRCDWKQFRKQKSELSAEKKEVIKEKEISRAPDQSHHTAPQKEYTPKQSFISGAWDNDITLIDQYFEGLTITPGPIVLNGIFPITNIRGFLYANLEPARAQNGNPTYLPYLTRVKDLIKHLDNLKDQSPIKNTEVLPTVLHTVTALQTTHI